MRFAQQVHERRRPGGGENRLVWPTGPRWSRGPPAGQPIPHTPRRGPSPMGQGCLMPVRVAARRWQNDPRKMRRFPGGEAARTQVERDEARADWLLVTPTGTFRPPCSSSRSSSTAVSASNCWKPVFKDSARGGVHH